MCKFDFTLKGPKGVADVELQGSSMEVGKIGVDARRIYYVPGQEIQYELNSKLKEPEQLKEINLPQN